MPPDLHRQSADLIRLSTSLSWALNMLDQPALPVPVAATPEYREAIEALRRTELDENYVYIMKADRRLKLAVRDYKKLAAPQPNRPDQTALEQAYAEVLAATDHYYNQIVRLALWPT